MANNNNVPPTISTEELKSRERIELLLEDAKANEKLPQSLDLICSSSVKHFKAVNMKVSDINDMLAMFTNMCDAVLKKERTTSQFAEVFAPLFEAKYSLHYVFG